MSYVATTGGISGDLIRDLIAESIEARFGIVDKVPRKIQWDYVHVNPLRDARSVMERLLEWFRDYNENHPHKGLKMMSPIEFRDHQIKLEQCPVNRGNTIDIPGGLHL